MKTTLKLTACLVLVAIALLPSACDGLNLFSQNVQLSIVSPESGATFGPGDTVDIEIDAENFSLVEPDGAKMHTAHPADDDPLGLDDEHEHPEGTYGHYHVYLDDADADDPHVTAYTATTQLILPDDLAAGTHTIRISLRSHDHTPLSESCNGCTTEATVEIECVVP